MSIVHLLCDASARAGGGLRAEWWLLALLAVSFAAAALAGVVPPRRASGPDRIPPEQPAWLLLGVMFGAMGVYIFTTSLYLSLMHPSSGAAPTTRPQELTAPDNAFASTVPPLLAFLTLLLGDAAVRDMTRQNLGIGLRRASRGIVWGLIGVVIVVPPLFLLEDIVEAVYRRAHYHHPTEHPLLHLLRAKPSPGVVVAIVIGACVIAPLFEELLFRGHLQTLLRRMLYRMANRWRRPPTAPRGFPVITAEPEETAPVPPVFSVIAAPPQEDPPQRIDLSPPAAPTPPTAVQTWAAIVLTSMIFASVHPVWSMPVIFVLALCLGYAYERTGNLWVSITLHAGFNTISTLIFLTTIHAS
jgi:membrane protease YdiL (CAAX protease family)